jgi:cytochrome c553
MSRRASEPSRSRATTSPAPRARTARRLVVVLVGALLPALGWAQDADAGKTKAAACMACHGPNGNSPTPVIPILAGQTARYIYLELRDFKEGRRQNPLMQPFAQNLSKEDMLDLGAFFSAQVPTDTGFKPDPAKVARGESKASETLCTMCHQGGMKGQNEVPRVAAQHHDYVVKQLQDFKAGVRTNDAGTMSSVAKTLSDQDMDDLAHYLESLY